MCKSTHEVINGKEQVIKKWERYWNGTRYMCWKCAMESRQFVAKSRAKELSYKKVRKD